MKLWFLLLPIDTQHGILAQSVPVQPLLLLLHFYGINNCVDGYQSKTRNTFTFTWANGKSVRSVRSPISYCYLLWYWVAVARNFQLIYLFLLKMKSHASDFVNAYEVTRTAWVAKILLFVFLRFFVCEKENCWQPTLPHEIAASTAPTNAMPNAFFGVSAMTTYTHTHSAHENNLFTTESFQLILRHHTNETVRNQCSARTPSVG